MHKKVEYYANEKGKEPFVEWLASLDRKTKIVVYRFIQKMDLA